jgi:hypothetical protein
VTDALLAFTLRPREFDAYEISSKGKELGQEKYKCHIPHYRVDDISSVTVVELKNAFEKSLADSSFTEGSFQVAGYDPFPVCFPFHLAHLAHLYLEQWGLVQSREGLKPVEEAANLTAKEKGKRRRMKC